MRALVPFLLGLSVLAVSPKTVPPTPVTTTSPGKGLHPAVRGVIDTKMEAHAQEMTDLVMLVVLLEREDAAKAADRIAAEPRIARAIDGSEASAGIPEQFFKLQDQLSKRATALGAAARKGDDQEMARAFGELAATCVACHTRYLEEE